MPTSHDLTLRDAFQAWKNNYKFVIATVAVFVVSALLICAAIPKEYGYKALIVSGQLAVVGPSDTSPNAPMWSVRMEPLAKMSDVKAYLEFNYLERFRSAFEDGSYVESIDITRNSNAQGRDADTIVLNLRAPSLELGKSHLQEIVKALQEKYQPALDDASETQQALMKTVDDQLLGLTAQHKDAIQTLKNYGSNVGALLMMQDTGRAQTSLYLARTQVRSAMSRAKNSNFQMLGIFPKSMEPVWPKTFIITLLAGVLAFFFSSLIAIFISSPAYRQPAVSVGAQVEVEA